MNNQIKYKIHAQPYGIWLSLTHILYIERADNWKKLAHRISIGIDVQFFSICLV